LVIVTGATEQQEMPKEVWEKLREGRGESSKSFLNLHAPEIMKELTIQLIDQRDIRLRERIRSQMKGILSFIWADTDFRIEKEKEEKATAGFADDPQDI